VQLGLRLRSKGGLWFFLDVIYLLVIERVLSQKHQPHGGGKEGGRWGMGTGCSAEKVEHEQTQIWGMHEVYGMIGQSSHFFLLCLVQSIKRHCKITMNFVIFDTNAVLQQHLQVILTQIPSGKSRSA
jgi:hypothetical protein